MKTVLKILAALAAVAGAVYVIATYGDKIVAWAKKLLASCPCCDCNCEGPVAEEAAAGEFAEEVPAEEPAAEEEAAEEVVDETVPVAEEADFEG